MCAGGEGSCERPCMRWSRSLHQLCVAFCCMVVYIPSSLADFLFAVTGNQFQADKATGRVIGVAGEIQRRAKQVRVTPGTSEGLSLSGVSFSSLLFSEPWPYFLSFFLWGRWNYVAVAAWITSSQPLSRKTEIVLSQQLSEKSLGEDYCLAGIAHPPLVQSPVDWVWETVIAEPTLCSRGQIYSQMKMRSQKATPIWRTLFLQGKLGFTVTSPIPLLLLLQHFVPIV